MTSLPDYAQAMLEPTLYPHHPSAINLIQTQMSFIFIAGEYVYKVKKPVNLGYLDYTTLEKRRALCHKEIELNRRLCPQGYLGVIPITKTKDGKIKLGGRGEIVEYAVQMRYLPQERMMNVLLPKNEVTPDMLAQVAAKLADFHTRAETNESISKFGSLETINFNTEENFSQTEKYVGRTVSQEKYERIVDYTRKFIKDNVLLFNRRVAQGRIRDCHGDLHAAHICFTDDICIYDCIEFNDRFRYCDVTSEIAFLAMDLDHYGRADLANHFIRSYIAKSGDKDIRQLLKFYKCYRAYVRGKVEGFKLDDPYIPAAEKERTRLVASAYFDLAGAYARAKPLFFITMGLVGTGKTSLAYALAKRLGLAVFSTDVIRKKLAGIPETEHRFEEFTGGIYSPDYTQKTYEVMMSEARQALSEGSSVILDASFIRAAHRRQALQVAHDMNADFLILECVLNEDTLKERLEQRLREESVSDGRWEVYLSQKQKLELVVEVPEKDHFVLDASKLVESNIREVLGKVT